MLSNTIGMETFKALLAPRAGDDEEVPECENGENATSYFGLRIASIFIILIGSLIGAVLPIWLARTSRMHVPKLCFFVAKYFGSGVILATAWMHLLSPASEALGDPCLGNILPDYDWAMGIGLMTVMVMFLIELVVSRFDFGFGHAHSHGQEGGDNVTAKHDHSSDLPGHGSSNDLESGTLAKPDGKPAPAEKGEGSQGPFSDSRIPGLPNDVSYPPGGEDHLGHHREHVEGDSHAVFAAQLTAIFILEFGVIFHSVFIGLTLAISEDFIILFVVLVFHQTFEGLGLGSRLATATWPAGRKRWMPYLFGLGYAVSTPLAIAIGLGVRQTLQTEGAHMKMVNGIFDAISGGILMYTGLVELLAHEFMFNPQMRNAGLGMQLFAYSCVALGAGLMALLAKWA
jgi:zinc transporter 1/2/3